MSDMTYYGRPTRFSFKVASLMLGGVVLEMIEPIDGDSIFRDFLKEHGEGIQHVRGDRAPNFNIFAENCRMLEESGFPCIMSARTIESAFAYFDTTKVLHTILEVSWRSQS